MAAEITLTEGSGYGVTGAIDALEADQSMGLVGCFHYTALTDLADDGSVHGVCGIKHPTLNFTNYGKLWLLAVRPVGEARTVLRFNAPIPDLGDGGAVWLSYTDAVLAAAAGGLIYLYAYGSDDGATASYEFLLADSAGTILACTGAGVGTESGDVGTSTGSNGAGLTTYDGYAALAIGRTGYPQIAGGKWRALGVINAPRVGAARTTFAPTDADLVLLYDFTDASKPTGAGPHANAAANVATGAASAGTSGTALTLYNVASWTTVGSSTPAIALDDATKDFTATEGGSNPAAQTVAITNSGTGTLDNLSVGTISYGAGWTSGVSASLDVTTAPATLTINVTTGALTPGTYTATVPVESTAAGITNSPQNVSVSFVVTAAGVTFPRQFTASTVVVGFDGNPIVGRPIAWTTTDPAFATVTPQGRVTQLAAGGSITATVRSGVRRVSVTTALPTT